MVMKQRFSLLASLLLMGLLLGLAACGVSSRSPGAGSSPPEGDTPDSVRIVIDVVTGTQPVKPEVTLTDVTLVRQIYATLLALPPLPTNQACTAELGPHYTLTFRQGSKTLVTALARRDGCRPVTLSGEAQDRKATQTFWSQLDQAIYAATPPAHPAAVAIQYTPAATRAPQTARIPSAAVAQRLYTAILALKWSAWGTGCVDTSVPRYQLRFQAPSQSVPAIMHEACNTVELQGNYQSRGGVYVMDDQFKQLFQQIVGAATFALATPDHLTLSIARMQTADQTTAVSDPALMQRLFQAAFTLPPVSPQPYCPTDADKASGKGAWYIIIFSQWDLPILRVDAYEGSCTRVELPYTQEVVQGNPAFWNLIHQAADQG